ncbi:MAG: hypothetical protein WD492_12970 [Alkalispirochaeta sp.]
MIYAEVDNEMVLNLRSGDPSRAGVTNYISLPSDNQVRPGTPITWYDDQWQQRPILELIEEGLVTPPEGMVWDDEAEEWRVATDKELVESGRLTVGEREILDGDSIRDMTPEELDERGLLTDEERRDWKKSVFMARLSEIDNETTRPLRAVAAGVDTEYDRQRLTDLENEAASIRAELAALESESTA